MPFRFPHGWHWFDRCNFCWAIIFNLGLSSQQLTCLRLWVKQKVTQFDWIVRAGTLYNRIHRTSYIHIIYSIEYTALHNSQLNCFTWDICSFELVANTTCHVQCGTCIKPRLTISNLLMVVIKNLKCFKYINDYWSVENEFRQSIWFVNDTARRRKKETIDWNALMHTHFTRSS